MIRAEDLGAFVDELVQRKYGDRLNPWFRATVTQVSGTSGNYRVQLQMLGDVASDGTNHRVAPTYVGSPAIGDIVEGVWRERRIAWILWKVP